MVAHPGKSEVLKTGSRPALKNATSVIINLHNHELNEVNTKRYLGVILNNHLRWNDHFSYICRKVYPKLRLLDRISSFLPRHALLCVYKQAIMPIFDYGCIVWMECTKHIFDKIKKLQNRAMRIILKTDRRSCSQDMRSKLGLLSLYNRRRFLRFQLSYRIVNNFMCPEQLISYLPSRSSMHGRQFRDNSLLHLPKTKSAMDKVLSSILLRETGIVYQNIFGN